ncbi:MAG: cation diffusion facilitator family transporter [Proteobacteria bacterium]|nr:cation diffusion facilitator family transporter [Pseudomonadota bacterium]
MNTNHAQLLKRVTYASVATAIILIIAKAIAWYLSSSIGILASLIDSLMDSFASIINLFAVRYALMPADEDHPYGHGKAEPLAGLAQASFIAGSAVFLIFNAIERLQNPQEMTYGNVGIAVMVFSIVITFLLVLYQRHVVKITNNLAIKADSLHYVTDLLANFSILIALYLTIKGYLWADAVFAILIALYIFKSAFKIGNDSFQQLMDKKLDEETEALILKTINDTPQALGYHDFRTRQSGKDKFIQFHLELDDRLSLLKAHEIADGLEKKLMALIPDAEIIIHEDPTKSTNATTLD